MIRSRIDLIKNVSKGKHGHIIILAAVKIKNMTKRKIKSIYRRVAGFWEDLTINI